MAYWDIAEMAIDQDLIVRCQACAAQEQPSNPWEWTAANILNITDQPGWAEAWSSAVAGGVPNPGRDAGVITDGMILSAVQARLAEIAA